MNFESHIENAIDYLVGQQDKLGFFESCTAASVNCTNELMEDFEFSDKKGWTSLDRHSVFPTILIGTSLVDFYENHKIASILEGIDRFIIAQKHPFLGAWNHFTKEHIMFKMNPYCADSTSMALYYLKRRGNLTTKIEKSGKSLLKDQISDNKRFYTFFTYKGILKVSWRSWMLFFREIRVPIATYFFWKKVEAERRDIDGVVNANILMYLNRIPETQSTVQFLINELSCRRELFFDKWYKTESVIFYLLSRLNTVGFDEFNSIFEIWKAEIILKLNSSEIKNLDDLDLALYSNVLFNLNEEIWNIEPLILELVSRQSINGSWKRKVFYFGGPKKIMGWGHETITTAVAIEALMKYQIHRNNKASK